MREGETEREGWERLSRKEVLRFNIEVVGDKVLFCNDDIVLAEEWDE